MGQKSIKNVIEVTKDTKICSYPFKKGTMLLQITTPDSNNSFTIRDGRDNLYSFNIHEFVENKDIAFHLSPSKEEFYVGNHVYYIHEDQVYSGELLEIIDNQCVISIETFQWKVNPETVTINKALVASENDVCTLKNDGHGCFFSYSIADSPTHKPIHMWDGECYVFA